MSKYTGHAAIDFETLALTANAVIASIAAVPFDPHGGVVAHSEFRNKYPYFFSRLEFAPQLRRGAEINQETIEWWMRQSDEARSTTFNNPSIDAEPPYSMLLGLNEFLRSHNINTLWARPSHFDLGILTLQYSRAGITPVAHHHQLLDVNTLEWWASWMGADAKPDFHTGDNGTDHDPVDDAINVARRVQWYEANFKVLRST